MKKISLEEFEALRAKGINDLVVVHDEQTQGNYYILANEKDKELKDNQEFTRFIEKETLIKIKKSYVRRYWQKQVESPTGV